MNQKLSLGLLASTSLLALSLAAPALAAADQPQDLLHTAKAHMQDRTWKVKVLVQGDHGMKIAGIIHDADFDLTVKTEVGESRQIAIGQKCWMSLDGGKTWQTKPGPDRRFYYLTHAPINYKEDEKIPPFEMVKPEKGAPADVTHLRFINPQPISYEGDRPNLWISLKDGKADLVLRSHGPLVFANDYVQADVTYTALPDGEKIVPPPGNIAAVPDPEPDAALALALQQMATGVWEADAMITAQKELHIHGLFEGSDYDLTLEGKGANPVHMISLKNKVWASFDGDKTWKAQNAKDAAIYRRTYNMVHTPVLYQKTMPPFEDIGEEKRDGETLHHFRLKVENPPDDLSQLPSYWVALDKNGKPDGVHHHEGYVVEQAHMDQPLRCVSNYHRAAKGITIKAPTGAAADAPAKESKKEPASPPAAAAAAASVSTRTVLLTDGKLQLDIPDDFVLDAKKGKDDGKTLATFTRKDGVWGNIMRGTHGLTPEGLPTYMNKRVAEYTKKLSADLKADIHWIRHDIVQNQNRDWADMRFIPVLQGTKVTGPEDYETNPLYTRFYATSYKGQLLEIMFTANLTTDAATKAAIDRIIESVVLQEK